MTAERVNDEREVAHNNLAAILDSLASDVASEAGTSVQVNRDTGSSSAGPPPPPNQPFPERLERTKELERTWEPL